MTEAEDALVTTALAIGPTIQKRGVFAEAPLDLDDVISRRHPLLSKTAVGGLILREIGSSPLRHWTRMLVKAAS